MTVYGRGLTPELIALRIVQELRDGMVVSLGIGILILLPEFVPEGIDILFHIETSVSVVLSALSVYELEGHPAPG